MTIEFDKPDAEGRCAIIDTAAAKSASWRSGSSTVYSVDNLASQIRSMEFRPAEAAYLADLLKQRTRSE